MKKLLSKKWFFDIALVVLVVVLSTVLMIPVLSSFGSWLNAMTDIVIGAIEVIIVTSALNVLLGEKKYRTWQYWVICVVSIIAVSMLFIASRATSLFACFISLALSVFFTILYALLRRILYVPSTWSFQERQQHIWEKLRTKATKMSCEDFLQLEMEFRCYPTVNGKIDGDLDTANPWATVESDEYGTIPVTAKGASARGMVEASAKIKDALVEELKASGII